MTGAAVVSPAMRHGRRSPFDSLAPVDQRTWLVVHAEWGAALEVTPLEPGADLRAILTAAREARIAAGWESQPIGRPASFFCSLDGVRLRIGINRHDPALPFGFRGHDPAPSQSASPHDPTEPLP